MNALGDRGIIERLVDRIMIRDNKQYHVKEEPRRTDFDEYIFSDVFHPQ